MPGPIFSIDVPATSANLGPGFDCFGLALQLYNKFLFQVINDEPGKLVFRSNLHLKQNPRTNLVYKAYCFTLKCIGYPTIPGLDVSVISDIPSARGLGSSATAVVAGVLAAGAVSKTNLRLSEAIEIATEIEGHPDNVAPAILGGMTVSIQDKNGVYSQKLDWPEELTVLVGIPDTKVRTQSARRVLPKTVSFEDAVFNLGRSSLLISSLLTKDWRGLNIAMQDKLHQNARASLIPGFNRIITKVLECGAIGCVLSGSGPCILSVVDNSNPLAVEMSSNTIVSIWKNAKIDSEVKQLKVQKSTTKVKKLSPEEFQKFVGPHWTEKILIT
ncbi:MAG: homoserine kinase [Candidatus Caenarcaniphilales bacterium]|nr:homoserine kinase [Candidatus Caenarcaniphilales bacterium]